MHHNLEQAIIELVAQSIQEGSINFPETTIEARHLDGLDDIIQEHIEEADLSIDADDIQYLEPKVKDIIEDFMNDDDQITIQIEDKVEEEISNFNPMNNYDMRADIERLVEGMVEDRLEDWTGSTDHLESDRDRMTIEMGSLKAQLWKLQHPWLNRWHWIKSKVEDVRLYIVTIYRRHLKEVK